MLAQHTAPTATSRIGGRGDAIALRSAARHRAAARLRCCAVTLRRWRADMAPGAYGWLTLLFRCYPDALFWRQTDGGAGQTLPSRALRAGGTDGALFCAAAAILQAARRLRAAPLACRARMPPAFLRVNSAPFALPPAAAPSWRSFYILPLPFSAPLPSFLAACCMYRASMPRCFAGCLRFLLALRSLALQP